jgi:hypothetical protein
VQSDPGPTGLQNNKPTKGSLKAEGQWLQLGLNQGLGLMILHPQLGARALGSNSASVTYCVTLRELLTLSDLFFLLYSRIIGVPIPEGL